MCGRFVRHRHPRDIASDMGIPVVECDLAPDWNITPRRPVAVVMEDGQKKLVTMRWGLIPSWAKDESLGDRMINARSETIAEKPSFREAFRKRRCLIVADGFYEWRAEGGRKAPFFIGRADRASFGMAGIYETWKAPDGTVVRSCSIVTTEANDLMRPIHHRMPVIVAREDHDRWLDPATPLEQVAGLMKPWSGDALVAYEVDPRVNSPANNDPSCVEPIRPGQQ